jgi:hypothetical protein
MEDAPTEIHADAADQLYGLVRGGLGLERGSNCPK